ncbi:MAG: hypothetical protein A3D31_04165 [Candidatus Fluviicola riflensis]|nr:MAG: hypothetical protein CHH17_10865 [Candidatus Fluviicola riflensis]OGS80076.1 MAG: hypothetical protein A3D31_04165 [Candidatus Fluviicola riflensis]OGS87248.1 MAG: hypothetical protein A2724_03625 [Fluviicola sp. RIFCSPHIGHO2_01_FULL_43_53]OGS88996.1 MAG: hypothetical protein A3E30_01035 [Fluviicola sp. RIFCSPHIGHO2_12_FULL_43_24]
MKDQNYNNYKRYYIPHHFIFYPIAIALISIGIYQSTVDESLRWVWLFLSVLTALLAWFSFMTRQHYGMTVQNRIILLEMRYRYFVITGERFELIEEQLSKGQIFALRFASDAEFLPLIQRTLNEQLSSDAIKQSIKQWKADHQRV